MADLTEKDLENMKNHKYSSTGYSSLDNKMNPFWTKCASFLPYRYSPNMVTLTGFLCQLSSILLISLYDLTFSERLPTYVYFFCAFMLFMAQTLDAIDGKHARNTHRQSSLGQLMDHGCDSMDNFLFSIVLTQAYLFGNSIHSLVCQIVIQIPFYIFTLEEHITGKIRTQFYNIGVTECQFFSMGLLILSGIFGESLVFLEIYGIRLSYIILYALCISAFIQAIYLITLNSNSLSDAFKKFNPLVIIIALSIAEFFCYKLYFYQKKPIFIILLNGLYYSLLTCKLIISNMAKKEIVILDIDLIIYIIGISTCIFIGDESVECKIIIGLSVWLAYRYYKQIIYSIFKMLDYLKISF